MLKHVICFAVCVLLMWGAVKLFSFWGSKITEDQGKKLDTMFFSMLISITIIGCLFFYLIVLLFKDFVALL